jgi:hypothetical protein
MHFANDAGSIGILCDFERDHGVGLKDGGSCQEPTLTPIR